MSETKQKEKEGLFDPRCARFGFQMVVWRNTCEP